jgi:hypothetical protein
VTTRLDPDVDKGQYLPYYPAPEPGPRPLAAILEDLRRPIHPNYLKTKRKGGADITFIEWHTAIRILERYAMGFHYRTRTSLSLDGQHVACDAEIGIPSSDYGITWRGSSGSDEEGEEGAKNYGDATDRAESQALRRAASKFGLGLPLYYDKDARAGRPIKQAPQRAESPAVTQQRSVATTSTQSTLNGGQQATIRNAIAALGWADKDCSAYLKQYGVARFGELSAEAAAEVIPDLLSKAAEIEAA